MSYVLFKHFIEIFSRFTSAIIQVYVPFVNIIQTEYIRFQKSLLRQQEGNRYTIADIPHKHSYYISSGSKLQIPGYFYTLF